MLKKFCVVMVLVWTVSFGWLPPTYAEKPDIVVSISQMDQVQKSLLNAVQKIDPQSAMMVQVFLAPGGPIIPLGLGVNSPLGIVGNVSGEAPDMALFGPVSNFKMLEAWFKAAKDSGRFVETATLKESGKNFVLQQEESAVKLPANPVELLKDLPSKYLLAVDLNPAALAEQAAALSRMVPQAGDNAETLQKSLEGCEQFLMGLNIDSDGDLQLTMQSKAVPGSDMEKQLQKSLAAKSMLAGFYDRNADAGFHLISGSAPILQQILQEQINQDPDTPVAPLLRSLIGCDALEIAASFDEEDGQLEMVLAVTVSNGKELLKEFQETVAANEVVTAEWNVDKVGKSISIHRLTAGNFKMALGTHSKFVFLAAGKEDAVKTLKETIAKTLKTKGANAIFRGHFDMDLMAGIPSIASDFTDLDGKATLNVTSADGTSSVTSLNLENEFLKSIVAIVKGSQLGETDEEDLFIEDDEDDLDDEDEE